MENELMPCPFCGCENIDPQGWMSLEKEGPECDECGATAESAEAWNRRATPATSAPSGEGEGDFAKYSRADLLRYIEYLRRVACVSCGGTDDVHLQSPAELPAFEVELRKHLALMPTGDAHSHDWVERERARLYAERFIEAEHARFKGYYVAHGADARDFERDSTGFYKGYGVQDRWAAWKNSVDYHATLSSSAIRASLAEALRNRNDSAHREREKLMAHIHKLETALWKMGTAGETALKEIRSAAPASAQHPDDDAVDRFAAAMKAKMAASRSKGRGGWDDPTQCSADTLNDMLASHLAKGDPVDVGNFAMMLWNRGERTMAPASAQQGEDEPPLPKALGEVEAWVTRDYGRKTSSETLEPYEEYCTIEQAKEYGDARAAHAVAQLAHQVGDRVRTDLSVRLRETADQHPGWRSLLTQAADEIERYYGGMLNWKRAAEANAAAPARAATTVPASESIDTQEFRSLLHTYFDAIRAVDADKIREAFADLIAHINAWHAAGVEKARQLTATERTTEYQHGYQAGIEMGKAMAADEGHAESAERAVPDGWKLVPAEATHEMKVAMLTLFGLGLTSANESRIKRSWHKALAAAPSPAAAAAAAAATEGPRAHGHRDDYHLLANARRIISFPRSSIAKMQNWTLAMELFATGSNSARQICIEAGIDPDGYKVERPRAAQQDIA